MDDLSKLAASAGRRRLIPAAAVGGLSQAIDGAGGLDGLLGKLRAGGLGDAVDSWVSTGPNQPVDPDAARRGARAGHGLTGCRRARASTSASSCRCSRRSCPRSSTC